MAEEKKRPSVADILAAARAKKADAASMQGQGENARPEQPSPQKSPEQTAAGEQAADPKPAAAKPAAPKPAGGAKLSVAEMLAAARAAKGPAAAPAPEATKPAAAAAPAPAAAKPAPKPAAAKAAPAAKAPPAPKETSSVLAAARAGAKPGPVSKALAAETADPKEVASAKAKLAAPPPVMPAKPAYAKTKADPKLEVARRGFIGVLMGSAFALGNTAMAVTGGLFTLGLARFMFPNILTEPPSRFKVGFKDAFANDKVDTRFTSQFGVWVVNAEYQGQRSIFALRTVCTHLGCTPNWLEAEQKYKCPCHGSGFYKDGINFEGPAPRPLERYAIRIADDGQLEIDRSKTFQEEMGQWTDPQSFVPV
jgi:cytochrome b6-f complex iron-sulfur subunit